MAVAIEGAVITKVWEGPYTSRVVYKRRCDARGHVHPGPPITVSALSYGTVMHGPRHAESFVCFFCGNRQAVKIEG